MMGAYHKLNLIKNGPFDPIDEEICCRIAILIENWNVFTKEEFLGIFG